MVTDFDEDARNLRVDILSTPPIEYAPQKENNTMVDVDQIADDGSLEIPDPILTRLAARKETGIIRLTYRCTNPKCKAMDVVKYFPGETVVPALNCWQCKNGFRVAQDKQVAGNIGVVVWNERNGQFLKIESPTSASDILHSMEASPMSGVPGQQSSGPKGILAGPGAGGKR
jgi:hypothetical protein